MSNPTLLLQGESTASHHVRATEALQRVLPDAELRIVRGQGHMAHGLAPGLFASEVLRFLQVEEVVPEVVSMR